MMMVMYGEHIYADFHTHTMEAPFHCYFFCSFSNVLVSASNASLKSCRNSFTIITSLATRWKELAFIQRIFHSTRCSSVNDKRL